MGFGGDLKVDQIVSEQGNVTINVPGGSILNASGTTWNGEVDDAQSQAIWQNLDLTAPEPSYEQQAITAFQNEVNADYVAYWDLLDNGTVQDGAFTLNAEGLALYGGQAALALDITDPTDADVQRTPTRSIRTTSPSSTSTSPRTGCHRPSSRRSTRHSAIRRPRNR